MPRNLQSGWKIFILSPVFYLTADVKKVASSLFHAGSTLVESKCIKTKTTPSEQSRNITIALKPFHMQYAVTLQ